MTPNTIKIFTLFNDKFPSTERDLKMAVASEETVPALLAVQAMEEILNNLEEYKEERIELYSIARKLEKAIHLTAKEKSTIDKVGAVAKKLGIKIYLAGGFLRDKLLGKESNDLDFVCDKDVEKLALALAKTYKLPTPVQYDRSQAISLQIDGSSIDIIDAQKLIMPVNEEDSLEGDEEFSVSFDDVYRRDLTINSLLYDIEENKLIDYTGKGLSDLKQGKIRTIISPFIKFKIHAPDILRALRFAVLLDFKLDKEMITAMKQNADRLTPRDKGGDVSNRRIRRELRKAAKSIEHWEKMKRLLAEVGLFNQLRGDIQDVEQDLIGGIKYTY